MSLSSITFVNGVNTHFGGSGKNANIFWLADIRSKLNADVFDTVPRFGFKARSPLYYIVLFFYFFPGSMLRVVKFPLLELFIKLSFFGAVRFMCSVCRYKSDAFVFSHHSSFYLAFFVRRSKRIFLVHDLLYVRARTFGYSRRVSRLILIFEVYLYSKANKIFILSYHEWRILRRLQPNHVELIACYDVNPEKREVFAAKTFGQPRLVMVSDWRRSENLDGLRKFFLQKTNQYENFRPIEVKVYGYGSSGVVKIFEGSQSSHLFNFVECGDYGSIADLDGDVYLVPIYQGAGIKIKILEAVSYNRMIIGTRGAFAGLPPYMIKYVGHIVANPIDVMDKMIACGEIDFDEFRRRYDELYCSISVGLKGHS